MTSETPSIVVENPCDFVLLIRIVRPEKRNALANAMVIRIAEVLAAAERDEGVRAVVLAGVEEAFCAGADIGELAATGNAAAGDPHRIAAWHGIERFAKPLIAACTGITFGAGNELALACDFIIAGRNARFGQPEVKLGGIPGDGGTQRLTRKVGPGFAAFMMFSGDPIDAETALRIGHVVEVVETAETITRALTVAAIIASRAPLAVQAAKACIKAAGDGPLELGIAFERNEMWKLNRSLDPIEGGQAFVEKRPPVFTGRWES